MYKIILAILILGFTTTNAFAASVYYNGSGFPNSYMNNGFFPPNRYQRPYGPPPPPPRYYNYTRYPRYYAYNNCPYYNDYGYRCRPLRPRNAYYTKTTTKAIPISRFDKNFQTTSTNKIVTCNGITYYGKTSACQ